MSKKGKFKKKIIIIDEKSNQEARAARLRKIRNMANLTRDAMCDDTEHPLNINTYKGWELAKCGGLPMDGAIKVTKVVAKEGVICSTEWLVHEIGAGPYVISDFKKTQNNPVTSNKIVTLADQKQLIYNEIMVFKKQFHDILDCEVIDDSLAPTFSAGDFVAGIKHYKNSLKSLVGRQCIIQLTSGEIITRTITQGSTSNKFNISCTNPSTTVATPIMFNVEILSAAPIIRHYQLESLPSECR